MRGCERGTKQRECRCAAFATHVAVLRKSSLKWDGSIQRERACVCWRVGLEGIVSVRAAARRNATDSHMVQCYTAAA